MRISEADVSILRSLARKLAEIAALPEQAERIRRWERFNALEPEKPMVLIDQLPWNELNVEGELDLRVADPYWRGVERWMRYEIYKWNHMPADMVVVPYVKIGRPYRNTGWGLEPKVTRLKLEETSDVAAQSMENLIQEPEDLEKIRIPQITPMPEETARIAEEADELFDGIIEWRFVGPTMHLGAWDTIAYWMGVENCYIEIMDRPEMIHALMEKMTQGYLSQIRQLNELKFFNNNDAYCHCSHTFRSDDRKDDECLSTDVWAFGLAQLFTSVSPRVTEEFECAYMKRIFPNFKHIYYGCCDRLDDRLDKVAALPNVRKISCSPWSVREAFAEKLPKHIIMSNKPSPALLANDSFDEAAVRADLRRTIDAARKNGKQLEMILKDVSTVRHDPSRVWRFSQIALEEAER